jgi:hypothetical protein
MANVKGGALATRLLWLRLNHGEAGTARLVAAASPALRVVIGQGVVRAAWYPTGLFIELNQRLDELFGAGDLALVKQLGRFGADASLTTIYRLFFKVGTVQWILGRASRLWGMHYDSGRMVIRPGGGDQTLEMEIADFDEPHRAHCVAVMGWIERSVELSGGTQVEITERSCRAIGDARCRWRLRWQ